MDEKIIRLCEENNVPSLVQALSTVKNQKVCVIISALVREGAVCKLICIITEAYVTPFTASEQLFRVQINCFCCTIYLNNKTSFLNFVIHKLKLMTKLP